MSRDFPDWIDVERAADASRRFGGQAPLAWMPRLTELLEQPGADDAIEFEIVAWRDRNKAARMDVHVFGSVPLLCQRGLYRYVQPVDSESSVVVVADEDELKALPEELEPKVVPEGRLKLVELVEDELLLALPLVPLDPEADPIMPEPASGTDEPTAALDNPFAALAGLKVDSDDGADDRGKEPDQDKQNSVDGVAGRARDQ